MRRDDIAFLHTARVHVPTFAALLQAQAPGSFEWAYLESGPDTWRVQITRREAGSCCGGCCGS